MFRPIGVEELTQLERNRAMKNLIFLVLKQDGKFKAKTCANDSTQQAHIPREDAASPTASTEKILSIGVIDVTQGRDVMKLDIPNAFCTNHYSIRN